MNQTIYLLWYQGIDRAPDIVKLCISEWRRLNPDFDVQVLMSDDLGRFGISLPQPNLHPYVISELLRVSLLAEFGGVWADATTLPRVPLRTWLPRAVSLSGFFAFRNPGPDRLLSSWFLAAQDKQMPLLSEWRDACYVYWDQRREPITPEISYTSLKAGAATLTHDGYYPYFWFFYVFNSLVASNPDIRKVWQRSTAFSAAPSFQLPEYLRLNRQPLEKEVVQRYLQANIHKLTYKYELNLDTIQNVIGLSSADQRPAWPSTTAQFKSRARRLLGLRY